MKKIITFAFMLLFVSGISFAAQTSSDGEITLGATKPKTVQLSNNVEAKYDGGTGASYVAATVNPKAADKSKSYLVTSESGATFYGDGADNISSVELPALTDFDNGTLTGWTKL